MASKPSHRTGLAGLALLALTAAMLSGCTAQAQPATAAIFVKDAARDDLTSLDVTFGQVAIHRVMERDHGDDDDEDGSGDHDAGENGTGHVSVNVSVEDEEERQEKAGWVVLSNQTTTIDLMHFQGNASAFLAGADVPVGRYNLVRLEVLNATATLTNGTQVPVKVPSGALRVVTKFEVTAGNETAITIDFDLDRGLHKVGDHYVLNPVLFAGQGHYKCLKDHDWRERERERDERSKRWERHDHDEDDE